MSDKQPHFKPITSWSDEDKPREKLVEKGRQSLTNSELIAILIGSGTKKETAVELAKKILLSVDNNLDNLGRLSIEELTKFSGIGLAKAVSIAAALEIGRRRLNASKDEKVKITSSKIAYELFVPHLADLNQEVFAVICLNRAGNPLITKAVSSGGISETLVDLRIIYKLALENNATSIILAHNHPSGNILPSEADIKLTQKIIDAGKIMNIKVLDHLIIGHNEYYSMADQGAISF
jgi:DNA repair protein RadC